MRRMIRTDHYYDNGVRSSQPDFRIRGSRWEYSAAYACRNSLYFNRDMLVPNSSILIVDDNVDVTNSLKYLLESFAYNVNCAFDGIGALHAAHIYTPDIVILDIGLPNINGLDVARRLRADFPDNNLLLIAVTGYGQAQDFHRTRQAGFDYHLVKPLEIARLMAIIEAHTNNARR